MKHLLLPLLLASLACSLTPASIAPARPIGSLAPATVNPIPDTPRQEFVVIAPVWVRTYAGDKVEAVTGGTFGGWCAGNWCYIVELQRKVWRGCTDRADGRGCQDE